MGAPNLYKLIRGACHTLPRQSRENSIQHTYFLFFSFSDHEHLPSLASDNLLEQLC